MRVRLIRLLVPVAALAALCTVLAAPAGAAMPVRLLAIGGLPRTFVQTQSLSFTMTARNRSGGSANPTLTAWLEGAGTLTRVGLRPDRLALLGGQRSTVTLAASLPSEIVAARDRLIVCAARQRLSTLPKQGCVRSSPFSVIASVRIATGQGATVRPTLDPSRAVTTRIGTAGGTVSASAADGSQYALTIPAGALAGEEQVTIVPITKLSGSGMKLAAGAQLEPDGLRLLEPATLALTPARAVTLTEETGFAYQGTGSEFGLAPLAPGRAIGMPVLRLGGLGVGSASTGQLSTRLAHPPHDAFAAFLSQLSAPVRLLRLRGLGRHPAASTDPATEAKGELGGFYNQYVQPSLRRAGSSLGAFSTAAQRTLAWERELDLLGERRAFAGEQLPVLAAGLSKALVTIWGKRTTTCAAHKTIGNLQAVLTLGHVAQALGLDSAIGGPDAIAAATQGCAQVTGQVSITIAAAGWQAADMNSPLGQIVSTVTANAPLSLTGAPAENRFTFASPHVAATEEVASASESTTYQTAGCSPPTFVSYTSDPSQMYAAFAGTLAVPDDLFDVKPPPWTFDLTITGADQAKWAVTCPPAMTPTPFTQSPQAMEGLGAVTSASPIRLTAQKTSRQFTGSADLIAGSSVSGFASARGRADVVLP
jgi:hypothetical protein